MTIGKVHQQHQRRSIGTTAADRACLPSMKSRQRHQHFDPNIHPVVLPNVSLPLSRLGITGCDDRFVPSFVRRASPSYVSRRCLVQKAGTRIELLTRVQSSLAGIAPQLCLDAIFLRDVAIVPCRALWEPKLSHSDLANRNRDRGYRASQWLRSYARRPCKLDHCAPLDIQDCRPGEASSGR